MVNDFTSPIWQQLEEQYLSQSIDSGSSRILLSQYSRALFSKDAASREQKLSSLARILDHVVTSNGTNLIYVASLLFENLCSLEAWKDSHFGEEAKHRLAALALISVDSLHEDNPTYFDDVRNYVLQCFNCVYTYSFNTRTKDLSDILFGSTWTSLFEAELNNAKATLDAVLTTKPDFVLLDKEHRQPSPTRLSSDIAFD